MTADELMRLVNRYTEACDDLGSGLFEQSEAETNQKHAKAKDLHTQILGEVYRLHTALDQARAEYEDLQQVTVNRSRNVALALRKLWPEKAPDAAHRLLLSCLNEDRPEHLTPEQLVMVLRLARAKSCHIGVAYILRDLGYADPQPIEPRDEAAELQRAFMASVEAQRLILARMERLSPALTPSVLRAA